MMEETNDLSTATKPHRYFDDSQCDREVMSLSRLWNRCNRESRAEFLEIAKEVNGGLIDV